MRWNIVNLVQARLRRTKTITIAMTIFLALGFSSSAPAALAVEMPPIQTSRPDTSLADGLGASPPAVEPRDSSIVHLPQSKIHPSLSGPSSRLLSDFQIVEPSGLEWLLDIGDGHAAERRFPWAPTRAVSENSEVKPVPEPGTVVFLILTGFFVIAWLRRNRRERGI